MTGGFYRPGDRTPTALDLLLLVCVTELSQFFIDGRSPLLTDVLIDMGGGGMGVLGQRVEIQRENV